MNATGKYPLCQKDRPILLWSNVSKAALKSRRTKDGHAA